jgi:hypothetical protein
LFPTFGMNSGYETTNWAHADFHPPFFPPIGWRLLSCTAIRELSIDGHKRISRY